MPHGARLHRCSQPQVKLRGEAHSAAGQYRLQCGSGVAIRVQVRAERLLYPAEESDVFTHFVRYIPLTGHREIGKQLEYTAAQVHQNRPN